jgi:hypothetical protein
MAKRINGEAGWVDPHNAGKYSVMEGSVEGKELHTKRVTGNKKFTDLQLFEFTWDGADCVMTGCSESQVTSYSDFSTNYCNLHDLYCGSQDGCEIIFSDFKYTEEVKSCSSADKGQCKPKHQALKFLQQKNVKPGSDFDENGCRHSLGEEYCAALHKCIRPWEEKCEEPKVPTAGGDLDAHGCKPSIGEQYCEATKKCIRPWEEKCEEPTVLKAGGDLDAHGCKASTGEQYCEATKKCIRPWEEKCEEPTVLKAAETKPCIEQGSRNCVGSAEPNNGCCAGLYCYDDDEGGVCMSKVLQAGGDLDAHGCKQSTGEQYCETTKKCIRPWEEKCEELGCSECQDRQKRGENISCPMCVMTV